MWAGREGSSALRIEDSRYFAPCDPENLVWPDETFETVELTEEDFQPRPALTQRFCWE